MSPLWRRRRRDRDDSDRRDGGDPGPDPDRLPRVPVGPPPVPDGPDPEWATAFMDPGEYDAFLLAVSLELGRRGTEAHIDRDGSFRIAAGELDGRPYYGLSNLAQMWHAAEPQQREDVIALHLAVLLDPERTQDLPPAQLADRLKVRLFNAELPPGAEVVSRPVADDLVAVLVVDLPDTVRTVHPDEAEELGRLDGLWASAFARLRSEADFDEREAMELDGADVELWGGDSFTATHALRLGELMDLPEDGALVAIPHRHVLLAHPIEDLSAVSAVSTLLLLAARMHAEGPGSLSPSLYWYRDDHLERLEGAVTDDEVEFAPSADLLDVLNRLDEPDDDDED